MGQADAETGENEGRRGGSDVKVGVGPAARARPVRPGEDLWSKAYAYLKKRSRWMRYQSYRRQHLPIGSGITEVMIKALKSGLPLGQMQVTKAAERVGRSVVLSVLAYLLLIRLYGRDEACTKEWSLFKLKERFIGEVAQEAGIRTELKWQRPFKQFKQMA